MQLRQQQWQQLRVAECIKFQKIPCSKRARDFSVKSGKLKVANYGEASLPNNLFRIRIHLNKKIKKSFFNFTMPTAGPETCHLPFATFNLKINPCFNKQGFIFLHLFSLCNNLIMNIFFCFAGELIEKEGNTRKEHHNTMENGIEEEH